ncbi:Gfo/Idh/MocA family protein [Singulisphaera sp. PoT]|uniref:Gfo/Idh/MocA family protein n=1 Tax=Singulisphaera sp. PoT TaxID=3411797 RepID=UPI003BF5F221
MKSPSHRRDFGKSTLKAALAGGALTAASRESRVLGANERVRVGCIGVGNRGCQVLQGFREQKDAEIVALCDVYEPYLNNRYDQVDPRFKALGGRIPAKQPDWERPPALHKDFRELLDRKDLDAVIVATPDHWHAIQTIMACDAGKDVYVEKPLSIAIAEGRRMIEAARRNNRVVQVGLHRRSSRNFAQIAEVVRSGKIGKVTAARAYRTVNMDPDGIGLAPDSAPPEGLDWQMWLGPRPDRPFNPNIMPYKFRWWHLYSSQIANWGVHYFDAMRWATGDQAPTSLSAHGGVYAVRDSRTIPDTAEVIFEMPSGMLMTFSIYEASGVPALRRGEIELRGTLGTLYADEKGYEIVGDRGGGFQGSGRTPKMKSATVASDDGSLDAQHARNFLDCVKSRALPNCDIEEGHRSTTFALLANISLATKSRLDWDAKSERITNNEQANELLDYTYRKPWGHA